MAKNIPCKHTILAPPKVGNDEVVEVVSGKPLTLNCDADLRNDEEKSSIIWLFVRILGY